MDLRYTFLLTVVFSAVYVENASIGHSRRMMIPHGVQYSRNWPYSIRGPYSKIVPISPLFSHSVAWKTKSSVNPKTVEESSQPDVEVSQFHSQDTSGQVVFGFNSPDQMRVETRNADGTVHGTYSYVDPYGHVIKRQYWDNGAGFHVTSNSFPNSPPVNPNGGAVGSVNVQPQQHPPHQQHQSQLDQQVQQSEQVQQVVQPAPQETPQEPQPSQQPQVQQEIQHSQVQQDTQHAAQVEQNPQHVQVQQDAQLPQVQYTPEVQAARDLHFQLYQQALASVLPSKESSEEDKKPQSSQPEDQTALPTTEEKADNTTSSSNNVENTTIIQKGEVTGDSTTTGGSVVSSTDGYVSSTTEKSPPVSASLRSASGILKNTLSGEHNGTIIIQNPEYLRISWTTDSRKHNHTGVSGPNVRHITLTEEIVDNIKKMEDGQTVIIS